MGPSPDLARPSPEPSPLGHVIPTEPPEDGTGTRDPYFVPDPVYTKDGLPRVSTLSNLRDRGETVRRGHGRTGPT